MSTPPSIVNVPANLDYVIEFVNNPDFDAGQGEQMQVRRVVGPSFETDEQYRQYFINKAKLAYLPDNETELLSLVRTLKTKRRLLEGLLDDLPKLLNKFYCLKIVIEGKYRKKMQEESDRLESHNRKVKDAEDRRKSAEKRYKTATAEWIGGKKEDDADKKEDEMLEMKDRVDRELQKGRAEIAAQQAALQAQQEAFKLQVQQMQQSFLQQAQDAAAVRAATVPNSLAWPSVQTARIPAPPPPRESEAKTGSPKRARVQIADNDDDPELSDVEELAKLFVDLPLLASNNDGASGG
jgi:hypothetical protein